MYTIELSKEEIETIINSLQVSKYFMTPYDQVYGKMLTHLDIIKKLEDIVDKG